MKPRFFKTQADLRAWFERNHARSTELWVGFHKKASGKPSITWSESVDEALCFGWVDSIRRSLDGDSYTNRFTPRKPKSTWSARNVKRARELIDLGLMRPKGVAAFEAREENRPGIYSYQQRPPELPPEYEWKLRANARAWSSGDRSPPATGRPPRGG